MRTHPNIAKWFISTCTFALLLLATSNAPAAETKTDVAASVLKLTGVDSQRQRMLVCKQMVWMGGFTFSVNPQSLATDALRVNVSSLQFG